MYTRTSEYGHVADDFFVSLGYPQDRDVNGKIVERLSEADHLQRGKVLNHEHQQAIRDQRKRAAWEKIQRKRADARLSLLLVKERNDQCEKLLLGLLAVISECNFVVVVVLS